MLSNVHCLHVMCVQTVQVSTDKYLSSWQEIDLDSNRLESFRVLSSI